MFHNRFLLTAEQTERLAQVCMHNRFVQTPALRRPVPKDIAKVLRAKPERAGRHR